MTDLRTGDETFLPETEQPAPPKLPPLGVVGWLRWAWRQLTSMRTALLLLLLLAVAAVPGSVLPQRRIDSSRVQTYLAEHTTTGPWLDRLGFFDVYTSVWFSAVYLLLSVSLVGCVLPRARQHWRAVRSAPPRTPRRLGRLPEYATATVDASPDDVLAAARRALRSRRYRVAVHDDGRSLAAERGYLAETGNLLFHLALLGLLGSVAYGSFGAYTGQVLVVEGSTFSNSLPLYSSFTAGRRVDPGDLPPFSFTLDRLRVRFETQPGSQLGAPRGFEATVSVRDTPGAAPRTRTVQVNHPLEVDGAKVYLAGNGYAPVIRVTDGAGRVAFRGPVPALPSDGNYTSTVVVKVPDAKPRQVGLVGTFLPTADLRPGEGWVSIFPDRIDPRLVLTAFAARPGEDGLGVNSGVPQSVYVLDVSGLQQLRTTDGQPARILLAEGQSATLPEGAGTVTFEGLKRFASFDVRSDPSGAWALGWALVALGGVTASLFVRRRRLWVRVSEAPAVDPGAPVDPATDLMENSDPMAEKPALAETAPVTQATLVVERPSGPRRTVVEVAGLARGEDAGLAAEVTAVLAGAARQKE